MFTPCRFSIPERLLPISAPSPLCSLAVALLLAASVVAAQQETFVTLDLKPANVAGTDAETMARYRTNPVNLRCDFVRADSAPLHHLIDELDNGETAIGQSYVTVFFPNGAVFEYQGYAWEGVARHGKGGPFVWEGKLQAEKNNFASVIIYSPTSATAYFSTQDGMYRLSRSTRQGHYFLCLRDPAFGRNTG